MVSKCLEVRPYAQSYRPSNMMCGMSEVQWKSFSRDEHICPEKTHKLERSFQQS